MIDCTTNSVKWVPEGLVAAGSEVEVERDPLVELIAGDRAHRTHSDPSSPFANGATATMERNVRDSVCFRPSNGSITRLADGDLQFRHLNRPGSATGHAFQGRTVDRISAAMPVDHPKLTIQQSFCVATSRARDRAELITDDV